MALPPVGAPAPAPMMDAPMDAPPPRTVLFTVMDNGDGTVSLINGDEPEEMAMAEGAEMGAMAPPGAPPMAGPAGDPAAMAALGAEGAMEPAGDVYDDQNLGDMLRVIMDGCVQAMGGQTPGMEEADMVAAYNGGA